MKEIFRDYLFGKGYLVAEQMPEGKSTSDQDIVCLLVALGRKAGIRIKSGARLMPRDLAKYAIDKFCFNVPDPFYIGFPETVRQLTDDELLFDQLISYARTYGINSFPGEGQHSEFEEKLERVAFEEDWDPKEYAVLTAEDGEKVLLEAVEGLFAGTRPLSLDQELILTNYCREYRYIPDRIGCKLTAVDMLIHTGNFRFTGFLELPDVIKILERIQYMHYGSEKTNRLNLRNTDRKILTKAIDLMTRKAELKINRTVAECFEKRETWKGLLHHLHYKAKTADGEFFVGTIRNSQSNRSVYAIAEDYMTAGRPADYARVLREAKGSSAVLRNLNYILSRCVTEKDVEEVLKCLD